MTNTTGSLKHLHPTAPFFLGIARLLISLSPPLQRCRGMGNGGCGQSVTGCFCHSFLLREGTFHSPPLLQHGILHEFLQLSPFHGLQHFANCSTVGLFCALQFSQHWTAPAWASLGVTAFLRHGHLLQRGVFQGLHLGICTITTLQELQGQGIPCSSTPSSFFFTHLGVCKVVSLTCPSCPRSTTKELAQQAFPLLNMITAEVLIGSSRG